MNWISSNLERVFYPQRYRERQIDEILRFDRGMQQLAESMVRIIPPIPDYRRLGEQLLNPGDPTTEYRIRVYNEAGDIIARAIPHCVSVSQNMHLGGLLETTITLSHVRLTEHTEDYGRHLLGAIVRFSGGVLEGIQARIIEITEAHNEDGTISVNMCCRGTRDFPLERHPAQYPSFSMSCKVSPTAQWLERWRR